MVSDQGLHCLPLIQQLLDKSTGSQMDVQILGPEWQGIKVSQYLEYIQ